MKLKVIDYIASAESLWRELETVGVCSYYQTYDWLMAWQRHVGESSAVSPRIVILSNGESHDEPLALLPFGLRTSNAGRALEWLGCDASSYMGPILTLAGLEVLDAAALDTVFAALPEHGLDVDYVDLDSQPALIRGHRNPFAGYRSQPTGQQSHMTRLVGDWQTYYAKKRSSKTRSKDRNRLRRMEEFGEVVFKIASTPSEIRSLVDWLIVEKSRQFNELGVRNILADCGIANLFRDVAERFAADGNVKLFVLALNGEPVAISYNVVHQAELHGMFLSYADNDVTQFGPGALLIHRIFEWCFANNIESFDFSIGDQSYKRHWCEATNPLHRSLWPVTSRGALYVRSVNMARRLRLSVKSSPMLAHWARRLVKVG